MSATEIPINLGPVFSRWETPGGRINISGMAGELLANASTKTFNITGPTGPTGSIGPTGGVGYNITGALNQTILIPTGTNYFEIGLNNGISLGAYESITPPVGGMLIPGQVSIGTGAPAASAPLEVFTNTNQYPYTIFASGIRTLTTGGFIPTTSTYLDQSIIAPSTNGIFLSSFQSQPQISLGAGIMFDLASSFLSTPSMLGNLGTINNFYGYLANPLLNGVGTVTNAYGGYFSSPGYGTNQTALAADNICCGVVAPTGIPITGTFRSAPQAVSTAFTYDLSTNIPFQNTLGYDALYSGNISSTLGNAEAGVVFVGVASTPSGAIAAAGAISSPINPLTVIILAFSVYVPNNYYVYIGIMGVGNNTGLATGITSPI